MNLSDRFVLLKPLAEEKCPVLSSPLPACTLIFSVSDGNERAETLHISGKNFALAWREGLIRLRRRLELGKLKGRALRVDRVQDVAQTTWGELEQELSTFRRNFFRWGLAFDPDFKILLTEQECNANAVFSCGSEEPKACLNRPNMVKCLNRRFPGYEFAARAESPVWKIVSEGAFCDEYGEVSFLPGPVGYEERDGLFAGHRVIPPLNRDILDQVITQAANWLAGQLLPSGKFVYGYFPCFDRPIKTYNNLRHAGTVYALLEAWERSGDDALRDPIRKAITYLVEHTLREYEPEPGKRLAFLEEKKDAELKLGGNAVSLLALVKWSELTGSQEYLPQMELLAEGIRFMWLPEDSSFVHVLNNADLSVKDRFRIIYYDGEAVFGLLRLYKLTRNERWLESAAEAFDSFLTGKQAKAHDHWLSYSANEITMHRPEERYFRFGIGNFNDYLDFVLERETTYHTLLELMMAAQVMLERLEGLPDFQHLLAEVDRDKFARARDYRAHYLLSGFFWPEMAMFFKNPDRIQGSFFVRHHAFRVRIDDVEHYLSGLIAYAAFLERSKV